MIAQRLVRGLQALSGNGGHWSERWGSAWRTLFGGRTASGVNVTEESSLGLSAAYRAITLLAQVTSTLPLHLYEGLSDADRSRSRTHPAARLARRPNPVHDGQTFAEIMTAQLVGRGNAYAEVVWGDGDDGKYRPVMLWPIPAAQVKPGLLREEVEKYYEVTPPNGGKKVILSSEECLHLRTMGDALEGWSPLRMAREAIGLGLAQEQHAAAEFGNGNVPSGILKFGRKPSQEDINAFKAGWTSDHGGSKNRGKIGWIWGEDANWIQTTISNVDAQFLENRKFQVIELARFFGVPPHLLYDLDRATFSNIEHQGLEFLAYTLAYWLTKWTNGWESAVLLPDERDAMFFEHQTAALLKTDTKTRYETYVLARQWGILDGNEIRKKENYPSRPDGRDLVLPSGSVRAGELGLDPKPVPASPAKMGATDGEVRRAWVMEALGRMIRKEAEALKRMAKEPAQFLAKSEEWYAHHRDVVADALRGALGDRAGVVAALHCEASLAELLDVAGSATATALPAAVERMLSTWSAKAEREAGLVAA